MYCNQTRNITVRFNPGSTGIKQAKLRLVTNDPDEQTVEIPLSGTATAASSLPDITVNPSSYNYSDVTIGSTKDKNFSVVNQGTATLNISSSNILGVNPTDFLIVSGGGSFSLSPGGSKNINVRFQPASTGAKSATLRVNSNDPDRSQYNISLSGTGKTNQNPKISISPPSRDFENVEVGTGKNRKFTVTNSGAGNLSVSQIWIKGDDKNEFAVTSGNAPFSLSPGSSREVRVSFKPISAGTKNAELVFESNAVNDPSKKVPVSGQGVLYPKITASTDKINFITTFPGDSVWKTLTIENTGKNTLHITSINIFGENSDAFSLSSNQNFSLLCGNNINTTVIFHPQSPGPKQATLQINSNDPDKSVYEIALSGWGKSFPDITFSPDSINFKSIHIHTSEIKKLMITNNGDSTLVIHSLKISDTPTNSFSLSIASPLTLASSDTQEISITFQPLQDGKHTAQLVVHCNDPDEDIITIPLSGIGFSTPDIAVHPESIDFGTVQLDRTQNRRFLVINKGYSNLVVHSCSITDDSHCVFSFQDLTPFTLSPADTQIIDFHFNPRSSGIFQAQFIIDCNDPDEKEIKIPIVGNGIFIDTTPPVIVQCYPPDGAKSVPQNTEIEFKVCDPSPGDGININSLNCLVNDELIVMNGADRTYGNAAIKKYLFGYVIHYKPVLNFVENSNVSITVQIEDLATIPNYLETTYTFTIGNTIKRELTSSIVDSNGGVICCDSTQLEIMIPSGVLDDSVKISIGTVDIPPVLPDGVEGIGLTYHFWPEGLQLKDSVIIRIPYSLNDLDAANVDDPFDLPLYYYLTSTGEWIRLHIFEIDGDFVSVHINEFCYLTLGKDVCATDINAKNQNIIPFDFSLESNYPNPFNPETHVRFSIPETDQVKLEIFNNMGQKIRTMANEIKNPGFYDVLWDSKDENGDDVCSGIYHIVVTYKGKRKIIHAALIK